jgi:hypothetical protein
MSTAHSTQLGHSLVTEGLEVPLEDLGYEEHKLKKYPMIWPNPLTGQRCEYPRSPSFDASDIVHTALQVHGQAAWKLYLKESPDGEERVIEDLAEVRAFMDRIMRPAIRPENIYAHHHQEQDVVLWYNRALWHCVVSIAP